MEKFGIYPKLDYFSAVFNDVSIEYVIKEFLPFPNINLADTFLNEVTERMLGYDARIAWTYQNIRVEARYDEVENMSDVSVFSHVYRYVQLQISGQGLDYLRSLDFDPDTEFRKFPDLHPNSEIPMWHVTRADFAFDLFNYMPDFLDKCFDYVIPRCVGQVKPRIPLRSSAILCSPRPAEHTLYLGSTRSDSLLRIYDKKAERLASGVKSVDDLGEGSWLRIEWQTRNKIAQEFIHGNHDYESIFKQIYTRFGFYDKASHTVASFWTDLFNWEEIPDIIQNAKTVESIVTRETVLRRVGTIEDIAFCYTYGIDRFLDHLSQNAAKLLASGELDRLSSWRLQKFLKQVSVLQGSSFDSSLLAIPIDVSLEYHLQVMRSMGFQSPVYHSLGGNS